MSAFLFAELVPNKPYHQVDLAIGQLSAKRNHAVAAFGNVTLYLGVGLVLEFAFAEIGDHFSVAERSPFTFGAVAYRTVLAK